VLYCERRGVLDVNASTALLGYIQRCVCCAVCAGWCALPVLVVFCTSTNAVHAPSAAFATCVRGAEPPFCWFCVSVCATSVANPSCCLRTDENRDRSDHPGDPGRHHRCGGGHVQGEQQQIKALLRKILPRGQLHSSVVEAMPVLMQLLT
jgi:hypothetical protein